MRATALALTLLSAQLAMAVEPPAHRKLAVLEYRAGARGVPGIGEKLARLLQNNAALEVLTPQDARRKAGPRLDAEVARCGGDGLCIGAIAEQLGADEVLLIGVSQLGDVVLAMQRIDARKGVPSARLAESLPPDAAPSEEQLLGWLRQLFPPEVFKRYGAIKIVADVSGGRVELNGQPEGRLPLDAVKVRAPATYHVRVSKPGYVPFEAGIDVLPDATVEVKATMVREEGKQAWYKRWYVWAGVGGALAIAGAGVAIYFGTRVDQTPMGVITLPPQSAALRFR